VGETIINYSNVVTRGPVEDRLQPRYDPLRVFVGSKTPAGLYARQKWRYEAGTETWTRDFNGTVKALRAGQSADGSWDNSEITTIQRLFGLHLTVREPDDGVRRALDWLLSADHVRHYLMMPHMAPDEMYDDVTNEIDRAVFHGLPFTGGCFGHVALCAGLFLTNCFGMGEEKKVVGLYDRVAGEIEERGGRWYNVDCTNNALRAFVTHAKYAKSRATEMMVDHLGRCQLPSGTWRGRTPQYLTFDALAHLSSASARRQCMAAVQGILKVQHKDGSWGRTEKEWNTFLVVHALHRLNS